MSLTPSNPRIMSPAWGGSIKLTPSTSPYHKTTPLRSPVKLNRSEATLSLKQVIGSTTTSANAFDSLPPGRCFAFTAGAAAVVANVDNGRIVSQRFYRARPTANPINPSTSVYGGPSTPTQNEGRSRMTTTLREAGLGASPLPSPATDWNESPGSKTWSARERVKAATCVSFSPDGRFLAVGETGHKPRVLIFSTVSDAPSDTPLSSLSDHTYGVRCVAFSPDSQYLASLGSANDGFLYVWSINSRTGAATLHSSNKCTSTVNRMVWMGNNLVTVGTRHVKVWRVEENPASTRSVKVRQSDVSFLPNSTHKTLPGRNCLLESLLEATFTSVVAVSASKAIVASDRGDICLIDDTDGTQRFSKVAEAGFAVTAMAIDDRGRLHAAGSNGALKSLDVKDITEASTPPSSPAFRVRSPTITLSTSATNIQAIAALTEHLVTIDAQRTIRLSHLCSTDDEGVIGEVVQKLPAHGDSVLGVAALVKPNVPDASYYTWSAEGLILFWGQDGLCKGSLEVELEQLDPSEAERNELRIVKASADGSYLVTGDRYGVLRIIDFSSRKSKISVKAHASEITDVAIFEAEQPPYVACCARDRTVQIFRRSNDEWDLLQTLDEHVGAVSGVTFSRDGTRLVSCSSDRTLVVRGRVSRDADGNSESAFLILRTVVLKATPVSIAWHADLDDVLLVSTIDRQVHRYDLRDGQPLGSFRASDGEGGDAVVLSSLAHIRRPLAAPLIAGVSSTDKSIRIYDEAGTLVTRDWGHTEGVTDLALLTSSDGLVADDDNGQRSVVTVAVDGTIFVWNLELRSPHRPDASKSIDLGSPSTPTNPELLASRPPLRRVLSQSELARFQRSPDEDQSPTIPTPTGSRSPKLRKRVSKFSLKQTPKLDPSPMPSKDKPASAASTTTIQPATRRTYRNPSPSPPSPRHHPDMSKRRASIDVRVRPKPSTNEFGSINSATESLIRTLRGYRKRLANCTDNLSSELAREVERELAHTARLVGERAKSGVDEEVMVKLLDRYSERLVSLLDEKISASVARKVRENSEGASEPLISPVLKREEEGNTSGDGGAAEGKVEGTDDDEVEGTDVDRDEREGTPSPTRQLRAY